MNFQKDGFSLEIISYNIDPILVELPIMNDFMGNRTNAYQTYQIVIDMFTTRFKNEHEFRVYLEELHPILKGKDYKIEMKYNGSKNTFSGNTDLIFGNNGELVEFLKKAKIKSEFYTSDSVYIDAFIDGFRNEVIEKMSSGDYHHEYTHFVTHGNFLYSNEMAETMKKWYDNKDDIILDLKNPFRQYSNIRGHCISHYIDLNLRLRENNSIYWQDEYRGKLEAEQLQIREEIKKEKQEMFSLEEDIPKWRRTVSYSILCGMINPCDTNKEFLSLDREVLDEMLEKYDLKQYRDYTVDPDEEMEHYNHLEYEDTPRSR